MDEVKNKRCFPLRIIFQDFFTDHRQKAYICVRKHWIQIVDLQNHIRNLFNLTHDIFLTDEENFLFPPQEDIEVLTNSPDGRRTIRVYREVEKQLNGVNGEVKCFKSTRNSTPFTNSERPAAILDITETPIVGIPPPKDNGAVLPVVVKKKRRRVRKRKQNQRHDDSSSVPEESREEGQKNHKRMKVTKSASHIRFVASQDDDVEEFGDCDEDTVEGNQITETPMSQTQAIVSRTLHKPLMDEEVEEGKTAETEKTAVNHSKIENKSCVTDSFALEELRERLPNMDIPVLKKFPKKDDVIAFKVLKMGESYEPGLSKFIIGIVETALKKRNELKLLILSGEEELKEPQGKFSLPEDQADENPDYDLYTVIFSNLHEVRRLDLAKLGTTL
ncbi:hypothetical protein DMENIID0001_132400 [Sergentomyia squamirostris]